MTRFARATITPVVLLGLLAACDSSLSLGGPYVISDNATDQEFVAKRERDGSRRIIIDPAVVGSSFAPGWIGIAQEVAEIETSAGTSRFRLTGRCSYWLLNVAQAVERGPMARETFSREAAAINLHLLDLKPEDDQTSTVCLHK